MVKKESNMYILKREMLAFAFKMLHLLLTPIVPIKEEDIYCWLELPGGGESH
jgi:hypothetical protein